MNRLLTFFPPKLVAYLALFLALTSMLGSLFFSEVWHLPPCLLCWYQRICMYPQVAIIGAGILSKDLKKLPFYVLPISVIGAIISVYHNLLYYGIIPEALAPCRAGVSCTTKFFEWFGFITIPFLSLCGFILIIIAMVYLLAAPLSVPNKKSPSKK